MATQPCNTPASGESRPVDKFQVRHRFVGLLFALAMTEVARQGVQLFKLFDSSESWSWPASSHLILSALLIATSWVGWSNSIQNKRRLTNVFDLQFLDFLVDIILVFIYFLIVSYVELPKDSQVAITSPSATQEACGIFVVFLVYAFWDLVADVMPSQANRWKALGVHASASLICAILSMVTFMLSRRTSQSVSVIALDISLIAIVFAFRAMKGYERLIARWVGWSGKDIEDARLPPFRPRDRNAVIVCAAIFLVGLTTAYACPHDCDAATPTASSAS